MNAGVPNLTKAQGERLLRFDENGLCVVGKDPYKNHTRLLERMVKMGLVTPYRHGGYEITEAGRAALKSFTATLGPQP